MCPDIRHNPWISLFFSADPGYSLLRSLVRPARRHGVCTGVRIRIERSVVWHLVSRTPSWFSCLLVLAVESWGVSRSIAGVMSAAAGMALTAPGGMQQFPATQHERIQM